MVMLGLMAGLRGSMREALIDKRRKMSILLGRGSLFRIYGMMTVLIRTHTKAR